MADAFGDVEGSLDAEAREALRQLLNEAAELVRKESGCPDCPPPPNIPPDGLDG
ncbi:MAG TPA: hypothetical protein VD838_16395 [Anaeromyxobacteraceae bacterium]|nr:hypothetical protein [Anaeromyxobacteraceae bacterium]